MRTKAVGYLMLAIAVLNIVLDAINGGSFDITNHVNEIYFGLTGAGFVYLRDAIAKLMDAIAKLMGSDPQMLKK